MRQKHSNSILRDEVILEVLEVEEVVKGGKDLGDIGEDFGTREEVQYLGC